MASFAATLLLFLLQAYLVSSVLVPHPQLTASQIREKALQPTVVKYSNDWAVRIQGGPEVVKTIADSHGFINMGQVYIVVETVALI